MENFDRDGHLDIMVSSWGLLDQLRYFRNRGDGTFADLTDAAGLTGVTVASTRNRPTTTTTAIATC